MLIGRGKTVPMRLLTHNAVFLFKLTRGSKELDAIGRRFRGRFRLDDFLFEWGV